MLLGASTVGTEGVEEGASTVGREAPATPPYVPAGLVSTSLVAVGRLISNHPNGGKHATSGRLHHLLAPTPLACQDPHLSQVHQ